MYKIPEQKCSGIFIFWQYFGVPILYTQDITEMRNQKRIIVEWGHVYGTYDEVENMEFNWHNICFSCQWMSGEAEW